MTEPEIDPELRRPSGPYMSGGLSLAIDRCVAAGPDQAILALRAAVEDGTGSEALRAVLGALAVEMRFAQHRQAVEMERLEAGEEPVSDVASDGRRRMTRYLGDVLDGLSSGRRRALAKVLDGSRDELLRAMARDLYIAEGREYLTLLGIADANRGEPEGLSEPGVPDPPAARGEPRVFDPETGELRDLDQEN